MSLCCPTLTAARFKGQPVLNLSTASLNPHLSGPKDKESAKESKCGRQRGSQSLKKKYHFDGQVTSFLKCLWRKRKGQETQVNGPKI